MRVLLLVFMLAVMLQPVTPTPSSSDAELAAQTMDEINKVRIANGVPPYAFNPLLAQAAQRHSEWMRDTGEIEHEESDGSTALDRVSATGYPYIRVGENIYAGRQGPAKAVEWWATADELHRRNVLHPDMREAGIGAATNAEGATYYTLVISAQPNVLPIFINGDEDLTQSYAVALTFTNETLFPSGTGRIGRASQVTISNSPDFANGVTQAWNEFTTWSLDISGGPGVKTVYVRYMDAAGNITVAQDSILYDPDGVLSGTVTATSTLSQQTISTLALTATASVTPTETLPSMTSTEAATETLEPTATAEPTEIAEVPSLIPSNIPTTAASVPTMTNASNLRLIFVALLTLGIMAIIFGILALMRGLRANNN